MGIGFVSYFLVFHRSAVGEIGFPDKSGLTFGQRGKLGLGSFRIIRPEGSGEILNPKLEIRNKPEIRNMKLET